MLSFLIVQTVLIVIILILFYLLSWFWPPDSPWAPWWATDKESARVMCKLAKVKKGDIIYDLGCGEGTALIVAANEFHAKGVGIEIDPWRVWLAKKKIAFSHLENEVKIIKSNFFPISISPASVVLIYLVPKAIERLHKKVLSELKPGTRVVSYRYPILYLPLIAESKAKKIFVYEVPKAISVQKRKPKKD